MSKRNAYILLAAIGISLVCYQRSDGVHRARYERMFSTYRRVMQEIEDNFIKEVNPRDVFDAGLSGMAEALDDPYSKYVPASEFTDFQQELTQEFGGIGINVSWDETHKTLKVASPLVGTPAFEAGLHSGDLILEVDGVNIQGKAMDDAVGLIKGKPGTAVRLKIRHEGQPEPREYSITRREIQVPAVLGDRYQAGGTWDFMLEGEPGIAYIRVLKFGEKTITELKEAMQQISGAGLKGVVLDLRYNPGGLLDAAVEVSDLFVDEGVIVSTRDRNGRKRGTRGNDGEYKAHTAGTYQGFPMAVLINGYSASASEIVAACLQDHGRAVIIGERSYGKGTVQSVIPLDDHHSALKLTIATYWRPSGKNIHRLPEAKESDEWGVKPNEGFEVKLDAEAQKKMREHRRDRDVLNTDNKAPSLNLNLDPQLKKAVEYLKDPPAKTAAGESVP